MDPHQFSIPMDQLFTQASIPNHHLPHPTPTTTLPHPTPTTTLFLNQLPSTPAQHPPYEHMITTAIIALNESEGSSKQAISKYIDRVFKNLPSNHSELLTYHMKRLKNSGQIMLLKRSYTLPSISSPPPPQPPFHAPPPNAAATHNGGGGGATVISYSETLGVKNFGTFGDNNFGTVQYDYQNYYDGPVGLDQNEKHGSVVAPVAHQGIGNALSMVPNIVVTPAEGNGAISGSDAMLVSLGLSDVPSVEVSQTKKRRGRPPKSASTGASLGQGVIKSSVGQQVMESGVGQGMMESVVWQGVSGVVAQSAPKRRPGRPRKNEPSVAPPAPGVLPVQVPVGAPALASGTGRPRGRPKRNVVIDAVPVAAPNGTLSLQQQPKKRGRKPKNAALGIVTSAVPVSMVMTNPGNNVGGALIPQQYTVGSTNGVVSVPLVASNGVPQLQSGKRRGRPPVGGMLKKQRKLSGKPLGRPGKVINALAFTFSFYSKLY
ncbi:hypothetical protein LIER_25376 [Lithospermum erythrorhizon]|uniref:H15 domain-containing protein n=1 Tax=Lithospermum erythrorhizon TaxID=34254 RepID=A0AAV3R4K4_LITER